MKRYTLLLLLVLASVSALFAGYRAADIPNPNLADARSFIYDPSRALNGEELNALNSQLYTMRKATTAETGVVIVPEIDADETIEDFTQDVFQKWGLGGKDVDNGLLIVVDLGSKKVRIHTGYGLEGLLPDITAAKLIRDDFAPAMREAGVGAALQNLLSHINQILTDPAAAEEIRSAAADSQSIEALDVNIIYNLIFGLIICMFLLAVVMWIYSLSQTKGKDQYHRALYWREHIGTFRWLAWLSVGLAVPFFLLARRKERRLREKPLKCSTCGAAMEKLGEEEDNALLSPSQDLEEKLDTVDYDVWVCPQCHTVERLAFPTKQTKYAKCNSCGTMAESLVSDRVIHPATTLRAGEGERVYECRYCGKRRSTRYKIPRKQSNTAVAAGALGAALSSRGGGGGGGGFSGGGFGGGSSGGGGATGGW